MIAGPRAQGTDLDGSRPAWPRLRSTRKEPGRDRPSGPSRRIPAGRTASRTPRAEACRTSPSTAGHADIIDEPSPETVATAVNQKQPAPGLQDAVHLRPRPDPGADSGGSCWRTSPHRRPRRGTGAARCRPGPARPAREATASVNVRRPASPRPGPPPRPSPAARPPRCVPRRPRCRIPRRGSPTADRRTAARSRAMMARCAGPEQKPLENAPIVPRAPAAEFPGRLLLVVRHRASFRPEHSLNAASTHTAISIARVV